MKVVFPAPGGPTTITDPGRLLSPKLILPKNKSIKLRVDAVNYTNGRPLSRPPGRRLQPKIKYVPSSEPPGRLTRLNFGAGWKPNLCCPAKGSRAGIAAAGDFLSTPYGYMHKLSAMFCTAVEAVFAHVKTSLEIGWQNCGD